MGRSGALLATLRNEQGKDLLAWLSTVKQHRPLILTGDFNADPSEAVVRTIKEELASAYPDSTPFTTWKIRDWGAEEHPRLHLPLCRHPSFSHPGHAHRAADRHRQASFNSIPLRPPFHGCRLPRSLTSH